MPYYWSQIETLERYHVFKEEHRAKIKDMLDGIQLDSHVFLAENNPAIMMRSEAANEQQFAERGFHNLTESATTAVGYRCPFFNPTCSGLFYDQMALSEVL